jgi:NitT/TauT family transport system permease protein
MTLEHGRLEGGAPRAGEAIARRVAKRRLRTLAIVRTSQLAIVALVLVGWEYVPQIPGAASVSHIFDPFFVSSPTRVARELGDLMTGSNGAPRIWPYVWPTLESAVVGTIIGVVLGAFIGLLLSNWVLLSSIVRPFIVAANAVPRVALIPVIVIIFGITRTASIIVVVLVVLFMAFYNSYEGGISVPSVVIQNAGLLGASRWQILTRVRARYSMAWTLAGLPLAATFALLTVITTEILTGSEGLGTLLSNATVSVNASLTFAVVIVLSVLGLAIVAVAELARARILHWWGKD